MVEPDDLDRRLDLINQRVNDIVTLQKPKAPWYRDSNFAISLAAFLISMVTTIASWYHSYQQDINATRIRLSEILERANALQRANLDYMNKFRNDPTYLATASVILNQQNVQLATDAYSLARSLGSHATANQLTLAAYILSISDYSLLSENLLKEAIDRADNSVEYVAALRLQGSLQFKLGNATAANSAFDLASKVFEKYTDERNVYYENVTQAYTQFYWAQGLQMSDCTAAKRHMEQAAAFWSKIPGAPQQPAQTANLPNCP